jgi:Rad3-related DNA helicase
MSYKYQDVSVPIMAKYLLTLLDKHPDEKGLIHVPYQLAVKLRPHLKHKRLMWHDNKDKDEAYKAFRATTQPAVLVASGMAEGVDLPYDAGRWQAIIKIQYPSLADNLMKYFMNSEPSWYAWLSVRTLVQQCGRICRGPDDYGVTYILDVAFENLLRYNKRLMPKYFLDALHIHKRPTK